MEKFKTIHENNVQINPFSIENQVKSQMESLRYRLKNLSKYQCVNGDLVDNELIEALDGEYIKLKDVLKLFGAKK